MFKNLSCFVMISGEIFGQFEFQRTLGNKTYAEARRPFGKLIGHSNGSR